jgi:phage shock protein A
MITRLNEQTARNEARIEIALENVDTKTLEIELDAEKLRASELVAQFKREMGKPVEEPDEKPARKIEIEEASQEEKDAAKTIGRTRTKS